MLDAIAIRAPRLTLNECLREPPASDSAHSKGEADVAFSTIRINVRFATFPPVKFEARPDGDGVIRLCLSKNDSFETTSLL
jgi:hypothetical protein